MKPRRDYYPWKPLRFAMSTATWSDSEVGSYKRLLDYQWINGSVPSDESRRNRIGTDVKRNWPALKDKFPPDPEDGGKLKNPVLEEVRAEVARISGVRRSAAEARWSDAKASAKADANADAKPMHPSRARSSSTSSSSSLTSSPSFDEFWSEYPNKKGKKAARRAYEKAAKAGELPVDLLARLEQHKSSRQWTRDGGDFIPYPATWINRGSWDDEITDNGARARESRLSGEEARLKADSDAYYAAQIRARRADV